MIKRVEVIGGVVLRQGISRWAWAKVVAWKGEGGDDAAGMLGKFWQEVGGGWGCRRRGGGSLRCLQELGRRLGRGGRCRGG